MEQEKALMTAQEVAALLGVKMCMAYRIIREAAGKLTVRGRVNRKYLFKKLDIEGV
mgnify:CR=1 FL=1